MNNSYFITVPDQREYRNLKLESDRHQVYYFRKKTGYLGRWLFDEYVLPGIINKESPEVILGLGSCGIKAPPCPQAIYVQNAFRFYNINTIGRVSFWRSCKKFFIKRSFQKSLIYTGLVFCQTRAIENRLKKLYGFRGKTVITSNVFSELSNTGLCDYPTVLKLHKNMYKILYPTRYYAHKGIEKLVEMMARYRGELKDSIAIITISAKQHSQALRLLKDIKKLGLGEYVINIGPLPRESLAAYYKHCDCLMMPTLLESFSTTYLEAMHYGLPILTSDLDFAREVCGDAALYFDSNDVEGMKNTLVRLKRDPQLREDLIAKGKFRLARIFSKNWYDIAREIICNLEELAVAGSITINT